MLKWNRYCVFLYLVSEEVDEVFVCVCVCVCTCVCMRACVCVCVWQLTVELYEILVKVDKHSEHMRYIDPICDCLYPLLHCLLGNAFVHLYS